MLEHPALKWQNYASLHTRDETLQTANVPGFQPTHRICSITLVFRYYPEFLTRPLLADRQLRGSDASYMLWSFASAEKPAPILWIFMVSSLWIIVSRLKCSQNLCTLLPPPMVLAGFIVLRHQTVLLITVNPFSLWLVQVALWLTR